MPSVLTPSLKRIDKDPLENRVFASEVSFASKYASILRFWQVNDYQGFSLQRSVLEDLEMSVLEYNS